MRLADRPEEVAALISPEFGVLWHPDIGLWAEQPGLLKPAGELDRLLSRENGGPMVILAFASAGEKNKKLH